MQNRLSGEVEPYIISGDFDFDKFFTQDGPWVIMGQCALSRNGLTTALGKHLWLSTKYKELNNLDIVVATWVYVENINYTDFVNPMSTNPKLLMPTKERALVESVKHIDFVDEGILVEAFAGYFIMGGKEQDLYDMCDLFEVDKTDLAYWIQEGLEEKGGPWIGSDGTIT